MYKMNWAFNCCRHRADMRDSQQMPNTNSTLDKEFKLSYNAKLTKKMETLVCYKYHSKEI